VSDESVLSTLQRGGEGQNVYRVIFFPTLVTKIVDLTRISSTYPVPWCVWSPSCLIQAHTIQPLLGLKIMIVYFFL